MIISLIIPVYNEQDAIPLFYKEARQILKDYRVELLFVNDGSLDQSEQVIAELSRKDPLLKSLTFTRNFGKEAALFAGLEHCSGDAIIPIDVDLQDPIALIPQMIAQYKAGFDVVLAKRCDRTSDSWLKRITAEGFYWLHNKISATKLEANVGDFRLMSREVVDNILLLEERNLFMKGILSWVGGKTCVIEYSRAKRVAGKSKFNGWKLWNLALEGVTSFSTLPIRVWSYLGLFFSLGSFLFGAWMIVEKLLFGNSVPGYPSLIVAILFLGGIQLIGIGILGEYIGRMYIETKNRPRYIIKKSREQSQEERERAKV